MTDTGRKLNILVVEDDFATRRQIAGKLRTDSSIVVELAGNVAEAVEYLASQRPHMILLDLGLPDGSGLSVIEAAKKLDPMPEILVLSSIKDEASVVAAISAGAGGYVVKDSSESDLLDTVDMVMQGFSPLSPSIARFILRSFRKKEEISPQAQDTEYNLTSREQLVLTEITRGSTYKKISQRLEITEASVQSHVKQIYRKLGVNSRTQAMLKVSVYEPNPR